MMQRLDLSKFKESPDYLLDLVRSQGRDPQVGKHFNCVVHDESNPSAHIYKTSSGHYSYKCFSCDFSGGYIDLLARLQNKDPKDVIKEMADKERPAYQPQQRQQQQQRSVYSPEPEPERIEHEQEEESKKPPIYDTLREGLQAQVYGGWGLTDYWMYQDPEGNEYEVAARYDKEGTRKRFVPFRKLADGGWERSAARQHYPYEMNRLKDAEGVVVVEGEKCVKLLWNLGIPATCCFGGANNTGKTDWSCLSGKKVWIWPDKDLTGQGYANEIVQILRKLWPKPQPFLVQVDKIECLEEKDDVVDFVRKLGEEDDRRQSVRKVLAKYGARLGVSLLMQNFHEETFKGQNRGVDWPWEEMNRLVGSIRRETVTLFVGDQGAGKSLFWLYCHHRWAQEGVPTAVLMLEDGLPVHLNRIQAMIAGDSRIMFPDWVESHVDEARGIIENTLGALDNLQIDSDPLPPLENVVAWMNDMAATGYKVLVIDPITALEDKGNSHIRDKNLIKAAQSVSQQYKCAVILTTHPKNSRIQPSLDNIRGARDLHQFSQVVLWLQRFEDPKVYGYNYEAAPGMWDVQKRSTNRTLRQLKGRHGLSPRIGFNFEGPTYRWEYLGKQIPKAKWPTRLKGDEDDGGHQAPEPTQEELFAE